MCLLGITLTLLLVLTLVCKSSLLLIYILIANFTTYFRWSDRFNVYNPP